MKKPGVVVITGASAGVGRAAARLFARKGARLGLIARGGEGLEGVRREVEAMGEKALTITADVSDATALEEGAERITRELGPIDVWVNAAMTTIFSYFQEISPEEYRRATEVTYLGTVFGTMAAYRRMLARNQGTIVQVGSALAFRSIPLQAAYCGAKAAIRGFTDSLRTEIMHRHSKIHVTTVHLPAVNTPQFSWCKSNLPKKPRPVAPVFQPEVAAQAIYWAALHRRRELYVGISSTGVIWGEKLLPWAMDHYLAGSAVDGQMTSEDLEPERQDNLFHPVPGDFGAHGDFDNEAHARSIQLAFTCYRRWILGGILLLAILLMYYL